MRAVRLSVKEMMIVVGLIGVLLGAFRLHLSIGSFLSGVVAIATVRTTKTLDQLRSDGHQIRERDRVWHFMKSIGLASILLATSLLSVIALMPCFMPSSSAVGPMLTGVLIASASIGYPVAFAIRRLPW